MSGVNPQMLAGVGGGGPGVNSQDQEKVSAFVNI
jgi:hypothetical protein